MIEVLPERDNATLEKLYKDSGISFNEKRIAVVAKDKDERLGYCLFELTDKKLTVLYLEPTKDLMLADGILRSALHVGVNAEVMDACYEDTAPEEVFRKLDFIGEEPKSLKVDKLFKSCCCGK